MSTFVRRRKTKTQDKLVKQVKKNTRMINSREKSFLRTVVDSTPDTTAVVQNIAIPAQGDDDNQRIGRKIHAEKIEIGGRIIKHSTASSSSVRYIIVKDNSGTTTAPVVTDIFENETDFFSGAPRAHNAQALKRFTILWDKHMIINEAFDGNASMPKIHFTKKLNLNILFTGPAITDEGKNNLYLISGSDEGTNVPAVVADTVFTYSDL